MVRILTVLAVLLLTASVGWAADVEGKIKSWDPAGNMVTLEDGTQLSIPADAKVQRDQLKEGAIVKASYDEKNGKKVVTSIQVTPGK